MKQVELKVSGMDCTQCERRLETALSRVDGVVRSKADHQQGSLDVVIDPAQVDEAAIRTAVTKAGFSASS